MTPKFYTLWENDPTRPSWVLCEPVEPIKLRRNRNIIPPVVNALLGPTPEARMRMKEQYRHLCCKTCGRFDAYRAFDVGFDEKVSIRIKGDFGHTSDRISVVSDAFVNVLREAAIEGFETKAIGTTGWHAFKTTLLVESDNEVIKTSGVACPECGRPADSWGLHEALSKLSLPASTNTFFTTKTGWPSHPSHDRSIFLSEEIAMLLKRKGIKGGCCSQLLTDKEWDWIWEMRKRGTDPVPLRGTTIFLSGNPGCAKRDTAKVPDAN